MSARMTPFHCPYCGEENLWPHEVAPDGTGGTGGAGGAGGAGHGAWECRSCQRAFKVSFLGILRPTTPGVGRADPPPDGGGES